MLNYNQKMYVMFRDADILTARHHNALNGLGATVPPKTESEQKKIDKLKALKTYSEVKATGTRTPYKTFMTQWKSEERK